MGGRCTCKNGPNGVPMVTRWVTQMGKVSDAGDVIEWTTTVGKPQEDALTAAELLWDEMQRHNLSDGELMGHCVDLAAGHVLTVEDGTAFRVIREHMPA